MLEPVKVSSDTFKKIQRQPNFGNDYNLYYLLTGEFPQNHVLNIEEPFAGYPKLKKLHELKAKHNLHHAHPAMGEQCTMKDLPDKLKSWASDNMHFDVVMVHGCISPTPSLAALKSIPVAEITPRPSLVFLWVPTSRLDDGRKALEHWGFRRSEDIVYFVSSKDSIHMPPPNPNQLLKSTTWHCLMGLKGTLRRSTDSNLINCNVDIDSIIERPNQRPNVVPEDIYELIENFSLMARRVHILPTPSPLHLPVRLRPGWLIVSPDSLISNVDAEYFRGNPRVPVDPEIDMLRPKTPPNGNMSK